MINNHHSFSKKGITIVYSLVIPLVVAITTIYLAYGIGKDEKKAAVPFSTLVFADYQMESAVIQQLEKLRNEPKGTLPIYQKEIFPGVKLTVKGEKIGDNWLFDVKTCGGKINRSIKVKGNPSSPDKITFLD